MSHWAEIDENNIVLRVTVGDNNDPNNDEGYQWLLDNLGGNWVKTSYNANFGKKFAGIGDNFIAESGNFMPPKPFESWTWSESAWLWVPPIEMPQDGKYYAWEELTQTWNEITE